MQDNIRQISLNDLRVGKSAVIVSVECNNKALRRHVLDMGLTPGTKIKMIKAAPFGDPIEISTRGYILTLRKADAACIKIQKIKNEEQKTVNKTEFVYTEHPKIGEDYSYKDKIPIIQKNIRLLTGSHQHVGNFPGVTIDRKDALVKFYPDASITDLPGIYSLSPYSKEEIITRDFILNEKPDAIINIVDATNIERNLYLTMQLIDLNVPMVVALNMMDEIHKNGGHIDVNGLEMALGVPVVPISAAKNEGVEELIAHAVNVAKYREYPRKTAFNAAANVKCSCVHKCINSICPLIEERAKNAGLPLQFAATKLIENDAAICKALSLDGNENAACKKIIREMEEARGLDKEASLADMRFVFIENLCNAFVNKPEETSEHKKTLLIDKFLTGKYTSIPAFFVIMSLIFYITFGPLGTYLSDLMAAAIDAFSENVEKLLTDYGLNPVVKSLIVDGIFAGVGSVLSFLPLIVILFLLLSILEDSGYMARVAFVMDKMLRVLGLSGRSFVPMLMGFGCSVPAIMSTRTLPSERDRKMTILLIPFMSCSAKLPIYALFTAAFFTDYKVLVVLSLYVIGIVVGIIFAFIVKALVFKGNPVPFVMELPDYRLPSMPNLYRLVYNKAKDFITKAFTIIFFATIIIWFLQNFDARLNIVYNSSESMLAGLGNMLVPVFEPLGLGDWRISTAFITGFAAKESVISTLSILLDGNVDLLPTIFTNITAFVFLVFSLLYTPCAAAIATVKNELGWHYAVAVVAIQCGIAWLTAFFFYIILTAL